MGVRVIAQLESGMMLALAMGDVAAFSSLGRSLALKPVAVR
jgi:hypothetical protein